jgi:membrane fusion protein, heavy metal efflux system
MKSTLFLTAVGILMAVGCSREKAPETVASGPKVTGDKVVISPESPQLASLGVEAAAGAQAAVLRLNGRLVWDETLTVHVHTPFAGRVTRILAEPGQPVKKGDVLALIASADYGQAQADARKAAGDFALAERTLNRLHDLLEHGAAAQKDVESAQADYQRTQSELQRASARLAFYGGSTNTVDQVYELKSPLDGIVVEKNLNPGQEVRPDQMLAGLDKVAAPLFTITDPTRLWIQLDAGESDLRLLKPGQGFVLRVRGLPGQTFGGSIDAVSDYLDPSSRTIKVRGSVPNPDRLLKAEMFVTVDLNTGTLAGGADVPAKAVFLVGEKYFLFIEESRGQFVRHEIKAGPEHDGKVLVLDGLKPGQRVVTDGTLLLEQLLQSPEGG